MKKLKLSDNDKAKLIKEFKASLETYGENSDDLKIKFEKDLNEKITQKLSIVFTASAYLKCSELVKMFPGEVGWHGLMRKLSDNAYLVYDILVMPQVVNGARAIDTTKTNEWYDKHEDVMDFMRFQAHSHVDFSTTPSTTDMDNQRNIVRNMTSCGGFALFQIWNKRGDINSFLYDIDSGLLYDRDDIEIVVQTEGEFDTLKDFTDEAKKLVGPMTYVSPAVNKPSNAEPPLTVVKPMNGYVYNQENKKNDKIKDPFYWKDETSEYDENYGEYYRWI